MKKVKGFNVGDKVFAKLKGYPAWPAIITETFNTKYSVKFYGTGETGSVKPKDVYYYLKYKKTFVKSLRRKDYNEAIEEIENAIKESGTDGNNEEDTTLDSTITSNSSINDSVDSSNNKTGKRKRSSSISSEKYNDIQAKKKNSRSSTPAINIQDSEIKEAKIPLRINQKDKILENNASNTDTAAIPQSKITLKSITKDDKNEETATDPTTNLQDKEVYEENKFTDKSEKTDEELVLTATDFNIVTDHYLQSLIAYAEHVRENAEIYKKRPVEERSRTKNEIVVAKTPEGNFVGIKYNREDPLPMKTEYEYAEYDESEAKTILSLKKLVEQGSCKPSDDPILFVTNLNIDEEQLDNAIKMDVIERKRIKLNWLRIESNLVVLDNQIKSCLGLDKANPEAALDHLHTMLKLEIDQLMLKKHPHVVDMIKRLRRYIGNIREWNMTENERQKFDVSAEKVRNIAADVYMKFAKTFNINDPTLFWDEFVKEVKEHNHLIKDMQEAQVFALSSEPYSRQAFLDDIDAKNELQLIASKVEEGQLERKAEKENLSKIANTDDNNQESDNEMENSN